MKKSNRPAIPPKMELIGDKESFEQRCNWNSVAQELQRSMRKTQRKWGSNEQMDLSEPMYSRRMKAAVDYTDRIINRYKHIPGLEEEHRDDTGKTWLLLNLSPCVTYNMIEERTHILCAAAIWILDQITAQPNWQQKLYPLLPRDISLLTAIHAPDLWDTSYDKELILSVMHVLYSRNIDIAPMEKDSATTERVFTSSLIAKGKQHIDAPSRRTYEALISLIQQEAIQQAVVTFESLLWAWIDRYFTCVSPMNVAIRQSLDEANQVARLFNELRTELAFTIDAVKRGRTKPQQDAIENSPLSGSNPFAEDPLEQTMQIKYWMSNLTMKNTTYLVKFLNLSDKRRSFIDDLIAQGYLHPDACQRDYGDEVARNMAPLVIADPYEICFALLWLIENDSDLPWLYGAGCGFMQEVSQSLPWGISEFNNKAHAECAQTDSADAGDRQPPPEVPAEISNVIPNWYERKYSTDKDDVSSFKRNLSQILYEETGCIMPRDLRKFNAQLRAIKDYGIAEKDFNAMLHLFCVLSHARDRFSAMNFDETAMLRWVEEEPVDTDDANNVKDAQTTLTYEDLSLRLKQVQEENARLRTSLHETEKTSRALREELSTLREDAELEHRELADMRELVFNQQTDTLLEEPDEALKDNTFPYEVNRNTVVFGGQDSWLKAIRPLLTGNIRFVGTFLNFDAGLVRYSDIIWIQPNALSHKQYYRIIDVVRTYRRPVRYFTRASATYGAKEIMKADQEFVKR